METRGRTQDGNGDESREVNESSSGDGNRTRMGTGTGTRIGSRRAGKRRRSARNCTGVVDAVRETDEKRGKDLGGKREKKRKKGLIQ